jgi:DNA polymerase
LFQEIIRGVEGRLKYRRQIGADSIPLELAQSLCSVLDSWESQAAPASPERELKTIAMELQGCKRCSLHRFRSSIVVGEGNPRARLAFVGEGPGEEEDIQGRPFVGPAGQLLTRIIIAMGFERQAVFIGNIVKCRPPGNRTPGPDEMGTCSPFLFRQLRAISPKVICALGAVAAQTLLNTQSPISRLRGRMHRWSGIAVMPTYHPSYLLRNPEKKKDVWEDMKKIMAYLK